jgi:hypothetical protein
VFGVLRREPAVDFQSAQEVLEDGISDENVLALAASQGRILISHDVNTMAGQFHTFLARNGTSPGLILISQSIPVGQAIDDLILIWAASEDVEWRDRISWLPL